MLAPNSRRDCGDGSAGRHPPSSVAGVCTVPPRGADREFPGWLYERNVSLLETVPEPLLDLVPAHWRQFPTPLPVWHTVTGVIYLVIGELTAGPFVRRRHLPALSLIGWRCFGVSPSRVWDAVFEEGKMLYMSAYRCVCIYNIYSCTDICTHTHG